MSQASEKRGDVLTVRALSGLSGDMMLTGMARLLLDRDHANGGTNGSEDGAVLLDALLAGLPDDLAGGPLPSLVGTVRLERRAVHGVSGWGARIDLPHEHEHRTLRDITAIIEASKLDERASELALSTFRLLAGAESRVHGVAVDAVTFHEVGALDSILDICLTASLFVRLNPARFVCSPLPLSDGQVRCAHGWIPTPAPATLELLAGVPVRGFNGPGETVTPTAIALLQSLGADFGPWPAMVVRERALVYGTRVFEGACNGAIWALGPDDAAREKGAHHHAAQEKGAHHHD